MLELLQGQRNTSDPDLMMADAAEAVGRYLQVERVGFFEMQDDDTLSFLVGWTAGRLPLLQGTFPAAGIGTRYLAEVRAGTVLGIPDARTSPLTADSQFPEIGAIGLVGMPIIRNGCWHAGFYVHHSAVRHWTEDEVALVRDVGEQTWNAVERARAEAALKKSEERLTFALEAGGGVGTWDWDIPLDRVYSNARFAELFSVDPVRAAAGLPLSELTGRIHPEDQPAVERSIQRALQAGGEFSEEYRIRKPGGDVRWVHARGRCHQNAAGSPVRFPGVIFDITERKNADLRLWQQWHSFDVALSNSPDFAYTFDLEGRFTYVNRALLSLWRKSLDEAVGKNFFELEYPPALAERLQRQIQWVIEQKKPLRDETPFTDPSGNTGMYEYIFVPVIGENGSVEAVAGTTRDITLRNRAEVLIEEDRRRWRDLLLQAPAAIALLRGPEHRFEWVNDDYSRLAGRPGSLLQGKTVREALPEVESQVYVHLLDSVYRTGQPYEGHESLLRIERGQGLEEVYVNFVYLPTRNGAGQIDGIFVHATDVTSLVLARKRVEESESWFRQLANSMPQMVWTARADGSFDYYNDRWYQFTGFDRSLPPGNNWEAILHPDDRHRYHQVWHASLQSGQPYQMEYRLWDAAEKRWRWFMDHALPLRDASGQVVKWIGTCTDIDEQKLSQQAILQTQKLESIGLLAGGIAHDFNNLLVGIMGGASFALETVSPSHPAYEMLQGVVTASDRAAHLTRQMLAYAGKGQLAIEPVDLSAMAEQTTALVGASIPKSVLVKLRLDQRLPTVQTDPGQMQQVVMNLIINAAEAIGENNNGLVMVETRAEEIPPGTVRRDVSGNVIAPGLYAVFEVRDTGCGIHPSILPKIFDPFFTTKFTGRGLGLAAVAGVVRSHHGALEVDSAPNAGSTFRVLLPARYLTPPAAAPPPSPQPDPRGAGCVLVIDDESVVRNVSRVALERSGYRALIASDGPEGLEFIRRSPDIALVLLDMSMPQMSGRQVLQELHALRPDLPVIICSGHSEDEIRRQFSGLPIAGILQKPFSSQRLVLKVRGVLELPESKN